jgi:outer membrane lipoprotein-sorting protein
MHPLSSLVLCALTVSAQAQNNDAERLYRNFEKKLTEAKAFKLVFDLNPDKNYPKVKGDLTLAAGNKMRYEFQAEEGGMNFKGILVSDGTTLSLKGTLDREPVTKKGPTPKNFGINARTCWARGGAYFIATNGQMPPDQGKLILKDFRMLPEQRLGERMARIIEFKIQEGEQDIHVCKIWFETKSKLPLKRTFEVSRDGKMTLVATEFYTRWQFEPPLNDKMFELPR